MLEPHIQPEWLIPQFRHHIRGERENGYQREGQQQVLRPTFEGIRDSVRGLMGRQMDALARKFAAIHDMKVKEEIERLAKEYGKLEQPWCLWRGKGFRGERSIRVFFDGLF